MKSKFLTIEDLRLLVPIEDNIYFKDNPMLFMQLIDLLLHNLYGYSVMLKAKGRKREPTVIPKYKDLYSWILKQTATKLNSNNITIATRCHWIIHGRTNFPVCCICGELLGYYDINVSPFNCYLTHCNKKDCIRKAAYETAKLTCVKRYGVENVFAAKQIKDKIKLTKILLYGDPNYTNTKKALETIKLHKKEDSTWLKRRNERYKLTCIKKFGVSNSSKCKTILKKFTASHNRTMLRKYGVKSAGSIPEVQQKIKETMYKKYGVEWSILLASKKKLLYDKILFDSKPELAYYIFLKDHNIAAKYHPSIKIPYYYNGILHFYCPDFIVDGKYVELKGPLFINSDGTWKNPYNSHEDPALIEAKRQCILLNNVQLILENLYLQYIDYVCSKYGKKFLDNCKIKN